MNEPELVNQFKQLSIQDDSNKPLAEISFESPLYDIKMEESVKNSFEKCLFTGYDEQKRIKLLATRYHNIVRWKAKLLLLLKQIGFEDFKSFQSKSNHNQDQEDTNSQIWYCLNQLRIETEYLVSEIKWTRKEHLNQFKANYQEVLKEVNLTEMKSKYCFNIKAHLGLIEYMSK